jgi:hypothetical protein
MVRNRLLLFWTICVYQVCYAPAMRIYLRLSAGVSMSTHLPHPNSTTTNV